MRFERFLGQVRSRVSVEQAKDSHASTRVEGPRVASPMRCDRTRRVARTRAPAAGFKSRAIKPRRTSSHVEEGSAAQNGNQNSIVSTIVSVSRRSE